MERYENKCRAYRHAFMFSCCLLVLSQVLQGCEPLRKKFTRQKKEDRRGVVEAPVLEPIEYLPAEKKPFEVYRHHYSLWQVWHKELIADVAAQSNKKRMLYCLSQVILHLESMQRFLPEQKQALLVSSLKTLYQFREDLEAPVGSISLSAWAIKMRSIERKLRSAYAPRRVQDVVLQ